MAGFVRANTFCSELRYSPTFRFVSSNQGTANALWQKQQRNAERMDPEPTNLKAQRDVHPDIKHPSLPDFLTVNSKPVVSDAFKELILELEPEKHQFVPVDLYDEQNQALSKSYSLMNVLQCCEAVIVPKRIEEWCAQGHKVPEVEEFWCRSTTGAEHLSQDVVYVDASAIRGLHLCRPHRTALWDDLLFSDDLLARVKRARLRKLDVLQIVQISAELLR